MQKRIVFDIDGTIATAQGQYEWEGNRQLYCEDYGESFVERHTITAMNYPHMIFPGYFALLRWLHQQSWSIDFFSSGVEERNVELVDELMKRAFGEELATIEYRTFSRQHAVDTDELDRRSESGKGGDIYQTYWYGQRKKKLGGVIVPEDEVANTLLVDDDKSYMTAGEEKNMISLHYSYEYPKKSREVYDSLKRFHIMHNAYYLAALLEAIAARAEAQQLSLAEAAYQIQISDYGAELNRELYLYPALEQMALYEHGLALLQAIEPDLRFYLDQDASATLR